MLKYAYIYSAIPIDDNIYDTYSYAYSHSVEIVIWSILKFHISNFYSFIVKPKGIKHSHSHFDRKCGAEDNCHLGIGKSSRPMLTFPSVAAATHSRRLHIVHQ